MSLPRSWDRDEWVEMELNGTHVRFRGVTWREYNEALDEAVREGYTGSRAFLDMLEEEYGADTEVVE